MKQWFGKYRGKVEQNIDLEMRGRIQVSVPTVLGDGKLSWAMPCAPYAGPGVGIFAVPPTGNLLIKPGSSNWTGTITKPMTLRAPLGTVHIGG